MASGWSGAWTRRASPPPRPRRPAWPSRPRPSPDLVRRRRRHYLGVLQIDLPAAVQLHDHGVVVPLAGDLARLHVELGRTLRARNGRGQLRVAGATGFLGVPGHEHAVLDRLAEG